MKHVSSSTMKIICFLALALPLVFFAWQTYSNITKNQSYQSWRVGITGYDPRNILKGRFIRYRYDYDWTDTEENRSCDGFAQNCCLCLTGEYNAAKASLLECSSSEAKTCDGLLKGTWENNWRGFDFGLREYYTDERAAKVLDKILRSGEVNMSVDVLLKPRSTDDSPQITAKARLGDLYVNGRPLSEMLDNGTLPLDGRTKK